MKKLIALTLAVLMTLSMVACGSAGEGSAETTEAKPTKLQVGYAAVDITPDEDGLPLSGYGRTMNRLSKGTLSYLYVTCTAITGTNGETILNYGMDIIGSSDAYSFAPEVTKATGVPEENIIMSASHTHSAPDLSQTSVPGIVSFKEKLGKALVEAAEKAMENRCDAEMYIATVETQSLNFVRRYVLENDTYAGDNYGDFNSAPIRGHETEVDNTMQLIKFEREADKDVVLANFQTHPHRTGGSQKYDVSADIVGRFRDSLGATLDCYVSYFTGGSANVNPTSRIEEENVYEDWKAHGDAMATAALGAQYTKVEGTDVYATSVVYRATLDHSLDHLVEKAKEMNDAYNAGATWSEVMAMGKDDGILGAFHAQAIISKQKRAETQDVTLYAHSVGNVGFIAAPYEMFDISGMEVKEGSPFDMTFICTCANGSNGYMPVDAIWDNGGYSVQCCRFVRGTADAFVQEYIGMLNTLKGK